MVLIRIMFLIGSGVNIGLYKEENIASRKVDYYELLRLNALIVLVTIYSHKETCLYETKFPSLLYLKTGTGYFHTTFKKIIFVLKYMKLAGAILNSIF